MQPSGCKNFPINWMIYVNDTEIEDLKKELKRTSSFLAALVDLSWPDSTYEQLDAQGRYDNTILALLSLLKAESTRQPLILFIEDVHFLDDNSKKFITRLKRALLAETTSYPIAVLMTTRWQGSRAVLEENLVDVDIDLDGLSDTAFIQMAQDILGQVPAPSLIKLVVERADGKSIFC